MHQDWQTRIAMQNVALQEWIEEEVNKTHGELDAQTRRMASQFTRYGLVVSDEYFPGPSQPNFSMTLRPTDWKHFLVAVLPVASLDHGESFVDKRSFPNGYGSSREGTDLSASESVQAVRGNLPSSGNASCACDAANFYKNPATPQDPFFSAAKTFMSWASESAFPSSADFPGGHLPKLLESRKTSTINDDPQGKKVTQIEHFIELTEDLVAEDKRNSPIDSRPSLVTELHRARMHELLRREKAAGAVGVSTSKRTEAGICIANAKDAEPAVDATPVSGRWSSGPPLLEQGISGKAPFVETVADAPAELQPEKVLVDKSDTTGVAPRRSRWGRKDR